jgi:hypothetical protein
MPTAGPSRDLERKPAAQSLECQTREAIKSLRKRAGGHCAAGGPLLRTAGSARRGVGGGVTDVVARASRVVDMAVHGHVGTGREGKPADDGYGACRCSQPRTALPGNRSVEWHRVPTVGRSGSAAS